MANTTEILKALLVSSSFVPVIKPTIKGIDASEQGEIEVSIPPSNARIGAKIPKDFNPSPMIFSKLFNILQHLLNNLL